MKTYIVTSAQNNTPVHKDFYECLKKMERKLNAEILVIPFRYKNPTSLFTDRQEAEEHWDVDVIGGEIDLSKKCTISTIKAIPTTKRPLSGISELCSGKRSFIIGSPVISHEVVPRLEGEPSYLISTGACTVENYTDSRSGKLGEFRHKIGAVIVDIHSSGHAHFRHVEFKGGMVCDISGTYKPKTRTSKPDVSAMVFGDLHSCNCDEKAFKTAKRVARSLKPKQIVIHDALDFVENSHHKRGDFRHTFKDYMSLKDELEYLRKQISDTAKIAPVSIVKSNHDEHLDRWIVETDPRGLKDGDLIRLWCEITVKLSEGFHVDALHAALGDMNNVDFWDRNDNVKIAGYYVSQHGDLGVSGTRGTAVGISNMPIRTITGHTHSSYRHNDNIVVGSLTPYRMDYSKGFMKNDQGVAVIYKNGTATNLNFIGGSYMATSI